MMYYSPGSSHESSDYQQIDTKIEALKTDTFNPNILSASISNL